MTSGLRWLAPCSLLALSVLACRRDELPEDPPPGEPAAEPAKSSPAPAASMPEPEPEPEPASAEGLANGYSSISARTMKGDRAEIAIKPPAGFRVMAAPTSPDPHAGKFTLAEATKGLPKQGKLAARIATSLGDFYCDLYDDKAPNTVANFVGLARGQRKYWDAQELAWTAKPHYDNTTFHRVVPGFMIQGGDRSGTGTSAIGYVIPDELHPQLKHDRPGQLCMANRGKNTGSDQFFITEGAAAHLDESYTIFGACEPVTLVQRIARVPQDGRPKRPNPPVVISKVEIRRLAGGAAKWMPKGAQVPPPPGVPAPGRAVMVPKSE